jgi:hypothetical protein
MPSAMKTDGPLKAEGIPCFETLVTANPPTEDHIPQDPSALYYQCDNVKSRNETGRAVWETGTEVSCLCII